MTSIEEKQKQKQDLAAILDAALDELEQDSDDDDEHNSSSDNVEVQSDELKNQPLENNGCDSSSSSPNDAQRLQVDFLIFTGSLHFFQSNLSFMIINSLRDGFDYRGKVSLLSKGENRID